MDNFNDPDIKNNKSYIKRLPKQKLDILELYMKTGYHSFASSEPRQIQLWFTQRNNR